MWKMLSHADAQLHLYPDSGHGFLYQYAEQFAGLINQFLDTPRPRQAAASRL
jgi:pimeloyl-ACP methyl ester carboxylesterase